MSPGLLTVLESCQSRLRSRPATANADGQGRQPSMTTFVPSLVTP